MKIESSLDPPTAVFDNKVFQQRRFDIEEFETPAARASHLAKCSNNNWPIPVYVNEGGNFFLPNRMETSDHLRNASGDDVLKRNLSQMKQLLVDESIPDHLVLHVIDYGYDIAIEDVGRLWLVKLVGELRFQPALDELREIMLHDLSYDMRKQAIRSISKLQGKKVATTLCEKLLDVGEEMKLRNYAAHELYDHPSVHSVKPLRDAYEETQYVSPETVPFYETDYLISRGLWMPSYCLRALGKIPSLEALEGIKVGFDHPLESVKHWARIALYEWIGMNAKLIADGKFQGDADEWKKLMHSLILKYGTVIKKDINLADAVRLYI